MKKADAILTSDVHLDFKQPTCWTDDFREGQEKTWEFIRKLQNEHSDLGETVIPILIGGDVFDRDGGSIPKWVPPELITWATLNLPSRIIAIPGQHDLPQHNMDLYKRSALAALGAHPQVQVLLPGNSGTRFHTRDGLHVLVDGFGWDVDPTPLEDRGNYDRTVAMIHVMTYLPKKPPYPGCKADNTRKLMAKLDGYDLILTGDNHVQFIVDDGDQILVNPGCIMRRTAAHIDYEPCVYLWYAEENKVEAVKLPKIGELTREHVDQKNERDERLEAFVEQLGETKELSLSFEDNLERFMSEQETPKSVRNRVWEIVDTRRMV